MQARLREIGETMPSLVRRLILTRALILVACTAPLALAQRTPVRVVGGAPHVSAPPIARAPMYQPPAYHPPVYAPRISTVTPFHGIGTVIHPPIRPIRPFPPIVVVYYPWPVGPATFWPFDSCWWGNCNFYGALGYVSVYNYQQYSPPNYVVAPQYEPPPVYGEVSMDLPQLYLKDGSILSVTDYWVVDDHLHFKMIEAEGAEPVEHDIPFDQLDLEKTIKANTARGFKFMLRDEPFDQYVRDHPDA